jgi:hypothetical protein
VTDLPPTFKPSKELMLMKRLRAAIGALIVMSACTTPLAPAGPSSAKLDAARNIVDSVNAKDSVQYARDLDEEVVVRMYDGEVRLRGRSAVQQNRDTHFRNHPNARNELVHLVEIDDRVIMHDKVWLSPDQVEPAEIVEVFTFRDGKIVQIDVIQPGDLFRR